MATSNLVIDTPYFKEDQLEQYRNALQSKITIEPAEFEL